MRSTKLLTNPPSRKDTPIHSFFISLQECFFCDQFEEGIQAIAPAPVPFLEHRAEMVHGCCDGSQRVIVARRLGNGVGAR
jgi:hypothetical protein